MTLALYDINESRFHFELLGVLPALPEVCLIYFHHAFERSSLLFHKSAKLGTNTPRGLVRYSELSLEFFRRDTILGRGEKKYRVEPKFQRRSGFMKYSPSERIELMATELTSVGLACLDPVKGGRLSAFWTRFKLSVAACKNIVQARLVVWELLVELSYCVFHTSILSDRILGVKG